MVSEAAYRRRIVQHLEQRGWVTMVNTTGVAWLQLGPLKVYDIDAALDHQRFLDQEAYEKRILAKPRFMWGEAIAEALGFA